MITGEFKIDPLGLGVNVQTIASVKVVNTADHPQRPEYGNYLITFTTGKRRKIVRVENHFRASGFWELLKSALAKETP